MDFLLNLIFDPTKTYIGLGALIVIMAICLIWFGIVERLQIKKRKQSTDKEMSEMQVAVTTADDSSVAKQSVVDDPVETAHVREVITVDEARVEMTDEVATNLIVETEHIVRVAKIGKKAIVNIDTISANFENGDVVDLAALQNKKLVSRKDTAVKVLARGSLNKHLTVVADSFSADAVKMIVLMGGEARRA